MPDVPYPNPDDGALQAGEFDEPVDQLQPYFREQPLQEEGAEAPPLWIWMLIFGVLFFGVYYLGRFIGDFSTYPWLQQPGSIGLVATAAEPVVDGAQVYSSRCANCHQADGQGVTGVFPPLVDSEWVTGEKGVIIRILLHGMQGPVEVNGEVYNGYMPAWAQLSDAEIAAVITHERQSWTNSASAVLEIEVEAVRALTAGRTEAWTAEELVQPANQTVPSTGAAEAETVAEGTEVEGEAAEPAPVE